MGEREKAERYNDIDKEKEVVKRDEGWRKTEIVNKRDRDEQREKE